MSKLQDHIRMLYFEKLTGVIDDEDWKSLQHLLKENKEARLVWDQLDEERTHLNVDEVINEIQPEAELERWNRRVYDNTAKKYHIGWKWAAAAAVVSLILSFFIWEITKLDAGQEIAKLNEDKVAPGIKLVLANGSTVEFSKEEKEFDTEGVKLVHSGSELVYEESTVSSSALNVLEVPAMLDYSITLSDGTRVFLNSESKLRFPFKFGGLKREVYLEGEAYLEVAKDNERPFIVHTSLTDVHVLGTKFNINTYEEGVVRTSLLEGKVELQTDGRQNIVLQPGSEASYSHKQGYVMDHFDATELLSWRDGVYYFQNRPLKEMADILGRWFGMSIFFESQALEDHSVSGLIEKGL